MIIWRARRCGGLRLRRKHRNEIDNFEMERLQSTWENRVKFNLSESSVHPMSARELVPDPEFLERLLDEPLIYNQSNGTDELARDDRGPLSGRHAGSCRGHQRRQRSQFRLHLLHARTRRRSRHHPPQLPADLGPDPKLRHESQGSPAQRGARLGSRPGRARGGGLAAHAHDRRVQSQQSDRRHPDRGEMDAIVRIAARGGAWILADEIYQGSERSGQMTPTFWGNTIASSSPTGCRRPTGSPGCASAGLSPRRTSIAKMWSYHDYTTIAPGTLSDCLARIALAPEGRMRCLERTRNICRKNFPLFHSWMESHGSLFRMVEPKAGAIAYVRYDLAVNSTVLIEAPAQGKECSGGAWRPLRHGSLPAHRVRSAARISAAGLDQINEILESICRA